VGSRFSKFITPLLGFSDYWNRLVDFIRIPASTVSPRRAKKTVIRFSKRGSLADELDTRRRSPTPTRLF
jgi:hypothetical protein